MHEHILNLAAKFAKIVYSSSRYCLTQESITKLVSNFPKIERAIVELINNSIDKETYRANRNPGQLKEHLELTGLCCILSNSVLEILNKYYVVKRIDGFYKIDLHPRHNHSLMGDRHSWLEIDGKILDFTANQFQPFSKNIISQVVIGTYQDFPQYLKTVPENFNFVTMDEDHILNKYIEKI